MNYSTFLLLCGACGLVLYELGAPIWVIMIIGLGLGFMVQIDNTDGKK
jgi:cyanate permease